MSIERLQCVRVGIDLVNKESSLNILSLLALSLLMSGCAFFGNRSTVAEKVPSCFSDGENQATHCKSKRLSEDGRIATTRCIGALNQQATPALRGKCVEKICSEGSNTDCQVKGEMAVLQEYSDLAAARLFDADESSKSREGRSIASVAPPADMSSDALVTSSGASATGASSGVSSSKKKGWTMASASGKGETSSDTAKSGEGSRKKSTPARTVASVSPAAENSAADTSMQLVLRPAKKQRQPAAAEPKKGFKKVCVASNESEAPANLRGKCATRRCTKGKCTYNGRREMFDWVASRSEI